MNHSVLGHCPVCDSDLHVSELSCPSCHTEIKGDFVLSKFNYLNKENLYFIEIFMKNKGNIKKVEKELGISYPTVKKQLDEIIIELGYTPEEDLKESTKPSKKDLLEKLARGELSKDDAFKLLGENYE